MKHKRRKAHTTLTCWALMSFLLKFIVLKFNVHFNWKSKSIEIQSRANLKTGIPFILSSGKIPADAADFPLFTKDTKARDIFVLPLSLPLSHSLLLSLLPTLPRCGEQRHARVLPAYWFLTSPRTPSFSFYLSLTLSMEACWGGYACSILSCADCVREDIKCVCVRVRVFGCIKAKTELALKRQRSTQRGHICLAACEF